jgi:hypothetical protein
MSTTTIVLVVAVVAVIAFLMARGGGPRITTIETRREKDEGESGK